MKQTFYILKNNSASEGTYLYKDNYKSLMPEQEITLDQMPTNKTENITVIVYRKDIDNEVKKPLGKKVR